MEVRGHLCLMTGSLSEGWMYFLRTSVSRRSSLTLHTMATLVHTHTHTHTLPHLSSENSWSVSGNSSLTLHSIPHSLLHLTHPQVWWSQFHTDLSLFQTVREVLAVCLAMPCGNRFREIPLFLAAVRTLCSW